MGFSFSFGKKADILTSWPSTSYFQYDKTIDLCSLKPLNYDLCHTYSEINMLLSKKYHFLCPHTVTNFNLKSMVAVLKVPVSKHWDVLKIKVKQPT